MLAARIHRVAVAGRLRTGEAQAVALVHAAGVGTVTTLLAMPPERRDPGLADTMFEAVLRQILTDAPARADDRVQAAAVAFRAVVTEVGVLGPAERALLAEWLDRVVAAGGSGSAPRG